MTRILCIYSSTLFYGHERSNIEVFQTLSKYDLLVLTNSEGISPIAKELLDNNGIKNKSILYPCWSDIRKPFKVVGFIRYFYKVILSNVFFLWNWIKFRPDYVYIANDFVYINLSIAFLLVRTPIVYRIGDAPSIHWSVFEIIWKFFIVKRTSVFVCISKYILGLVRNAGRGSNLLDRVIYNLPPSRQTVTPGIDYSRKGVTFGYLGQIIQKKGVAIFIETAISVCSSYSDVYFILAGDLEYDLDFSKKQLHLVQESGFKDRILFLGSVENIRSFFDRCDVLVTPSLKEEPLGNVLVEAKFNSTPSIIFKSGGMPELISHEVDGYICEDSSVDSLNRAIVYYLNNQDFISKHGENAFSSIDRLHIGVGPFRRNWIDVFA